jgi:hypothetical protein
MRRRATNKSAAELRSQPANRPTSGEALNLCSIKILNLSLSRLQYSARCWIFHGGENRAVKPPSGRSNQDVDAPAVMWCGTLGGSRLFSNQDTSILRQDCIAHALRVKRCHADFLE